MRRFGAMPYITPLQSATESSTTPKSVMNTTVGCGTGAATCWAETRLAARSKNATGSQTAATDFLASCNTASIEWSLERLAVYERFKRTERTPHFFAARLLLKATIVRGCDIETQRQRAIFCPGI